MQADDLGLSPPRPTRVAASAPFLRFQAIPGGDRFVVTSFVGDFAILARNQLERVIEGRIQGDEPWLASLRDSGLLSRDPTALAARYRARIGYLFRGPSQLAIELTTRETPDAVHPESPDGPVDMPAELAERCIDTAFMTTSSRISVHLVGGEPLAARDSLKHVIRYAKRKNLLARKYLSLVLHTSLRGLDPELCQWLCDERVLFRVVLPAALSGHKGPSSPTLRSATWADAGMWLPRIHTAYVDSGISVEQAHARVVVRASAGHSGQAAAWGAALRGAGARHIEVSAHRSLQDVRADGQGDMPLEPSAFGAFYGDLVACIAAWDDGGRETTAEELLRRIGLDDVASDTAWRAPAADGVGALAFGVDGIVSAGLEGHALRRAGDDAFALAHVRRAGYHDLVAHPTVRSLVVASALEGHPEWSQSAYAPYLGTWPTATYVEQGSVHGRLAESPTHQRQVALLDALFSILDGAQGIDCANAVRAWTSAPASTAFFE